MKTKNRLSFCSFSVQNLFLFFTVFLLGYSSLFAQTLNIPAGSVVLDMGVAPQTINNGLKPYGLAYSLIKDYNTPIMWCIEPTKAKDGIDFTVDGRDFRGGTFVILEEFLSSSVLAEIANWEAQGVVTYTTQSQVTAPLYKELKFFANWVLDEANGGIAAGYLDNAGIPVTSYIEKLPNALDACDDLFILPHADPTWTDHGSLYQWNDAIANGGNAGYIWSGCHAVSALEDMYNPANPAEQTNFLSTKTVEATNNGDDYFENALILWGHNSASGILPYQTAYPGEPFMQFIGQTDEAHAGGSEQIYIPVTGGGWRPSTRIGAWDPNQTDSGPSPREAALIAYGYAFGDTDRGQVMYEGGHTLTNGSEAENVAAQRAFLNFSFDAPAGKVPTVVENAPPATLVLENGDSVSFNITGTPATGGGITYNWSSSCSIGSFDDPTSATPTFTLPATPIFTLPETCTITGQAIDDCGRLAFVSYGFTLIPPPTPPVANNDDYATYNTNSISFNPLDNDTDINENIVPSSFTPTSPLVVAGGTFVDNGNGDIIFNPTAGFSGTATLDYQICDDTPAIDGGPFCDTATINVVVSAGSCAPTEIITSTTDYATAVQSSSNWRNPDRALGVPDANFSLADNDTGLGWVILDLGGDVYIGSDIQFRIFSDNGTPVSGTIDYAVLPTDFPTANQTVVNVSTQDPATDIVTISANLPGVRYVRITGATKVFGLESVQYERETCVTPSPPVANDDNLATYVETNLTFNALDNDSDPDNDLDPTTFTPTSSLTVAGGTFVDNGNGDITFMPNSGFTGTANLDYQVCDQTPGTLGGPFCDIATITVTVLAGSCAIDEIATNETDYAQSVHSENKWKNSDRALGAPDTNFSLADDNGGTGWLILDLGANAYIGSTIKFRIYSDDGNPVSGTIDAAVLTTDFPTTNEISVNTSTQDPSTDIVTFTVVQAGIRYVRITGATTKFGLESVEFEKEICIAAPPTITASDDDFSGTPIDETAGGTTTTVFTNDDADGTTPATDALIDDNISISNDGGLTGVSINTDGTIVVPAGSTPGTYTVEYTICLTADNSICDTANVTIEVAATPTITATNDDFSATPIDETAGGTTATVFTNDEADGTTPATDALIDDNISISNDGGLTGVSINTDGTIVVPAGSTPGTYTVEYTICLTADNSICDTANVSIEVEATPIQADLSLTKTVNNATPKIGETIIYVITLTNSGPASATGIQVQDILPAGLLYDSGSSIIPAGTTYNHTTGIWDLSTETIDTGVSYILQIAAKITPACGEITNVAQIINSDNPDPDSITNNGN